MFRSHEGGATGESPVVGGGALAVVPVRELAAPLDLATIGQVLPELPSELAPEPPQGIFARLNHRLRAVDLAAVDWAPDLAEEIGSRRWYRGMATLVGLALCALACWPDFSRLEAAPATRLDAAARDEFRSQSIMPLGYGGATGRPMGPRFAMRPVAFVPERAQVELASVLAPGDSLGRMLQRAGVSGADAARASELVAATVPLDEIRSGTRVALVLGPRPAPGLPRPLEHAEFRARFDLALAVNRAGGGLVLQKRPIPVDTVPLRIRGQVGESLYRAARASGAPPQAIQEYLQALDGHISLEGDIQSGDLFDLVFAVRRAATGETEVGDLLYAGLQRGQTAVAELLRWGNDGAFYSADSFTNPTYVQTGPGMLMPVNGRITSSYGTRFHPVLGYRRMHAGVDFGAAWGSPIVATAAGAVSYAGYHGGHGNYVRLDHGSGLGTGYAHMSRIAVTLGERVGAGEVIGYVGSTGLSTGPHLHYEMYRDGRTVNPLGARFATVTRQVDPGQLHAFRARLAQMKAIRPGAILAARPQPAVRQIAMR
ncbi:MAG: M23 family metallopeptidase [Alphaproteobacteria bacterium]|nr:M23 family metallopeptidase [Alphaproteobacteria bacterium]